MGERAQSVENYVHSERASNHVTADAMAIGFCLAMAVSVLEDILEELRKQNRKVKNRG